MEARKVNIANGWLWIKQGYWLLKKSPVLWVSQAVIGVVGLLGISTIPVIGDPLATLLFPILLAGYMFGCRALEHDEELELSHLLAGFHNNTAQLVTLGGISLICQMLILGVMMITGGATLVSILMSGQPVDNPEILAQAATGAGFALMLGMTLFSMLLMAMQFAPMLIIFDEMSPIDALKASLLACLRNILPLWLYGAIMLLFMMAASMPMMLGWLVLLPVMLSSMYAIYRDLFPTPTELAMAHESETNTPG
ncbi:conserved membrane hypothetical protein [Candidatus Nitrotoga sp. BS]|uniref:BPSS1780 family membrane protein n=1 Tax=Candidatus Nitrotoga sp. BS TaxID=2890408 RepID=UPI001EF37D87|nr:BPSS1780 family membrane protein [Candidatus Nitrotoga sp. BS]CAH1204862.1 conserved membrane hypothetical protein [Candidatus Nitrotoga sp. BS]